MIHLKINNKSDENAWYIRKSSNKVLQTHDTLEILICDLAKTDESFEVTWRKCDRVARSQIKISSVSCVGIILFVEFLVYHALWSHFLLMFECIIRFHHFLWVASKSYGNAWYTRKLTTKVMKTHHIFENKQNKRCKRMIHSKFGSVTLQKPMSCLRSHDESVIGLQGRRSTFRECHAFASLFLWFSIVSCVCITFVCWFSNVSCVFITFCGSHQKVMKTHYTFENQQHK